MADEIGFSSDLLAEINQLDSLAQTRDSEAGRQAAEKELANLDLYQVAANSKEERDPRYVGEIEGLLRSNNTEGLKARLGEARATQVQEAYNAAWRKVEQDRNLPRSAGQVAQDTAVGIGGTVLNGIQNAEAAVMGSPVGDFILEFGGIGPGSRYGVNWDNEQYASVVAQQNQQVNKELIDPLYSSTLKNQRKFVGLEDAQDERDHALSAQDAGEAARGEFLPTLGAWTGRVASDALSGAENTLSNPVTATQGTTDAIGSMLLAGAVTKPLTAVGEKIVANRAATILEQQLAKGVERTAAEKLAAEGVKALEERLGKAAAGAGVAATEGASAYQQQSDQVMNTSLDDLTKNSPAYNAEVESLQAQGVPFEEAEIIAKRRIANRSAQDAAGKTAVVSAGIGWLLPEGAQDQFKVQSAGTVAGAFLKDAAKEGVEEFLQGGSGQLIGNAAQQKYVDPNQDILSGVGTQAGAGGVLGIASSGVLKAPSTAGESVGLVTRKTGEAIANRAQAKLDEVDAQSPTSVGGITQRTNDLRSDESNLLSIKEAASKVLGEDPEADKKLQSQLTGLINSGSVNSLPGSASGLTTEQQTKFPKGISRAQAVDTAARMLLAEKDTKKAAPIAQFFSDLMEPVRQFQQTSGELERLQGSQDAMKRIGQYQSVLADIAALPAVQKAQTRLAEVLAAGEHTPASLAALATVDPAMGGKVSAQEVSDVLTHAEPGTFTDAQQAALKGSLALLQAREAMESSREPKAAQSLLERHLNGDRNQQTTSRQTTVEMNPANIEADKYSARVHTDRIIQSMMSGNTEQAGAYLTEFGNFVQHFQNKVSALNQSIQQGGKRVSYQQYVGNNEFADSLTNPKNYKHKDVWVNLKSEASLKTAQDIDVEANLLSNLYEGLRQAYPELQAKPIQRQDLKLETKAEPSKSNERRAETRPVAAPVEKVETTRPTSKAIENLRGRLQNMNARDRARLVGTDYVTGLRTRASWEESPRNGEKVMILTSTAVKPINDDPNGGHDVTNDLLRVIGAAVGKIDPNAARSGTNFILETNRSTQDVMDEVRKALPDQNIELAAGQGPDLESAFQDEKATTNRLREEGTLPARGETKFDLKKLVGINLSKSKAQEKLSQQTVDRVRKLSNEEFQAKVLEDPVTPGVLSGVGWRLIPRKAFVASIDLKGLKKLNDLISAEFGDKYLRVFSEAGLEMGGAEFDFAHLSGDEYAVQSDSKEELQAWLDKLEKHLQDNVEIEATHNGAPYLVTPAFRQGIGTSYGDADKVLNTAKRAELAAAAAAQQQAAQADSGAVRGTDQQGTGQDGTASSAGEGQASAGEGQEVAAPQTTAERFPNLFQVAGKIRNYFHESQKLRPDTTRISGTDSPVSTIRNAISNDVAFREFVGQDPRGKLTPEVVDAYQGLLTTTVRNIAGALNLSLKTFLEAEYENGKTAEQMLKDGDTEINAIQRAKVLNLVELGPDGKFRYNSHLMGTAIMAALQWNLSATQRQPVSKPQQIAEELGAKSADDVPSTLMKAMTEGMNLGTAKQTLTQYIRRFWGVHPDPKAPMGFADAIPEAMAAELLRAMEDVGILKVNKIDMKEYPQFESLKTLDRYITVDSESALNNYPELIEEAVVKNPEFASYYGDSVPPVADRQLSNSNVKLSEETKKALGNMQAQKFYLNMPLVEGILQLDENQVIDLFGNPMPKDAANKYNKQHLESLESQNVSLRGAFKELRRLVGEMRNLAGDQDVGTLGKKFQYAVNSVNRIMMLGAHNPQANKLMREMLLPTWSTLDMTNPEGAHYRYFMQAFAQAMGQKVHQKSWNENVKWSNEAIAGSLAPALGVLSSWLRTKDAFPTRAFKDAMTSAGMEVSPLTTMALTEVARFQNSTDDQKAAFRTPLYLESDGMTNGPFNSMGLLAVGEVTESDIQNWRRGGLSIGAQAKTADQLRGTVNKTDLYKEGMNAAQVDVNEQLRSIQKQKDGQPILTVARAMFTAMNLLLNGEVSWDEEKKEWQFERGLGKNPSTVLVYGAGNKGIAGKLVSRLTNAYYEKLSAAAKVGGTWEDAALEMFPGMEPAKALQSARQLKGAMDALSGYQVAYHKEQGKFFISKRATEMVSKRAADSYQKFKFTKEEVTKMEENMLLLMVDPMKNGIRRVLGPSVFDSGDLLVKATQFQSIIAREMYLKAIDDLIAAKIARKTEEYRKAGYGVVSRTDKKGKVTEVDEAAEKARQSAASEFLSKEELQNIWKDLKGVMPMVSVDGQNFMISKNDLLTLGGESRFPYSRALDGNLRTEPYADGIAPAGVTARPYLTIGMGDARMVRKVFEQGLDGAMQVFDGINIPVDKIGEYGSRINQAAMTAWQADIFKQMLGTFQKFLNDPKFKDFRKEVEGDSNYSQRLIDAKINTKDAEDILADLTVFARMQEARNKALAKFAKSMDQMAGTYKPHVTEGIDLGAATDEQIRDAINQEIRKNLDEKIEQPKVEGVLHQSGASVYTQETMPQFLKWLSTRVTKEEGSVLREIFKSGNLKGTRIVIGTSEQVQGFQQAEGLSHYTNDNSGRRVNGYYNPTEDVIYLMNNTVETAVHELIHAGTYKQVLAHYNGKGNNFVKHLETLMGQFLSEEFEDEGEVGQATQNARKEILSYQGRTDAAGKASALNEFMAWALANRTLTERLSKVEPTVKGLAGLAKSAYEFVLKLMGKLPTNMASQIRFSTAQLAKEATVESKVNSVALAHATVQGVESNRLTELSNAFSEKIARYLVDNNLSMDKEMKDPLALAKDTANRAQATFGLNDQAADTFQMMVAAFATEASVNPQAMIEAQEIYEHFLQNMKQADFLTNIGDENADREQAKEKFEFISGHTQSSKTDASGRSTLLPSFLALAAVDDVFRGVLSKKQMPERIAKQVVGMDSALEVAGEKLMDKLSDRLTGSNHPENVRVAIDQLTQSIIKTSESSLVSLADKLSPTNTLHTWNDKVSAMLERAGAAAGRTGRQLGESRNPIARGAATVLKAMSALSSEENAAAVGEEVLRQMDKYPGITTFIKDVVADMIGRTASQANVYDMIKRVRALVSQTRQAYRENVPAVIASKFKTEPTATQWNMMYNIMGRYDMASLLNTMSVSDALELAADGKALSQEISRMEAAFGQDAQGQRYLEKINQYVNFIRTGERGSNLLRNAYAISELLGESKDDNFQVPTGSLIQDIDQLMTLKLLEQVPENERESFSKLLTDEREGLEFTMNYLKGQRATEMAKATEGMARFNHYKGLMPAELKGRGHVVVVDDAKHTRMVEMGYTRMGAYEGSSIENKGSSKSYWYSSEGGVKTTFNQGIAQNVQGTAYGVRTETGTSLENHAGIIDDPTLVKVLAKKMHREAPTAETLSPIYNASGALVAFERSLNPKYTKVLQGDQHLAKMIGEWKGRQVEETWASKVNQELLGHLHEMYANDNFKDRYVNLLDDKLDPVVRDAIAIMPGELKAQAEALFGKGNFMVRRNLLNSVIGYRNASVGDLWTGTSRWSPQTQEAVRKALIAVPGLGVDAYRKLVWAERNWQAAMAAIRTNIVVRSMIVPAANFMSGIMQLNVRGIPLMKSLKAVPGKVAEVEFYSKTMAKKIALEAERFANESDVTKTRKIDAQLTALNDSLRRLSIWPLIKAGEFSTISDVGQTAESLGTGSDTLVEKLSKAVDEMPVGLRDLARQGYMARDTAIFQALQKSVQYSDFIMKAIYFDHLRSEGQSEKAALSNITEEFNNYDVPPGRDRGYAESIGLAWFLNYKIRATKIGLNMIRKNPLNLLMYMMVPHPSGVGIPGTDNLISSLMEMSMGRSFGPGMATSPISLNPWYNLVAN